MNAIETELEKALRERREFDLRFKVALWGVVMICAGMFMWVVFR